MTPDERAADVFGPGTNVLARLRAVCAPPLVEDVIQAASLAVAEERAATFTALMAAADRYEKDGEPGELGYNCWGWRDIARALRREAVALLGHLPASEVPQ